MRARWASVVRSGGTLQVPPHPSGNGWVEGSKARILYFLDIPAGNIRWSARMCGSHGMDAAALTAIMGMAGAGNAKGVFYDN